MAVRFWCVLTLCLVTIWTSGCSSLLYKLRPDQLRKLNRGPPPHIDPEFTWVDPALKTTEPIVMRAQNPENVDADR